MKISTETESARDLERIGQTHWKDQQIGLGVSRCPIDPDDYSTYFGRQGKEGACSTTRPRSF